jgi:hypothetical protein
MPARKRETIDARRNVRKDGLKKVGKSRAVDSRPKARIVAKPGQGERKGHWPPW